METNSPTDIQTFYAEKSLFVTGVSGFLGKALLEKLLRSCPNVGTINVLIRSKNGVDVQSRLETIFKSPIFEVLRSQNSDALRKVRGIKGDMTLSNLGISEKDRSHLIDTVSVVIHSAASVRFNEPIKVALDINYHGTERILSLCHEMTRLTSFVHVSTAYSNCDLAHVPEKIIPPTLGAQVIDALTDEEALRLTPILIGNKPNTYVLTKALSEHLLQEQGALLPITVVRPSIIGASWKEPVPGFIDSMCGITGILASSGKGFLTCVCGDASMVADIIPLDITVNLIIAAGYDIAKTTRSEDITVYNCCTGHANPLTYDKILDYCREALENVPFNDVLRYPRLRVVKMLPMFHLVNFIFTFLPCLAGDVVTTLITGKKGRLVAAYKKMITSLLEYSYFGSRQWSFESRNMDWLQQGLSPADNVIFFTNVKNVQWRNYIHDYMGGIKKWIFKEDIMADIQAAKRRMSRMWWIHKLEGFVMLLIVVYVCLGVGSWVLNLLGWGRLYIFFFN